jgi:hypothetical protein
VPPAASIFSRALGGEGVGGDGEGTIEIALGEDLDPAPMADQAMGPQQLRSHLGAGVELVQCDQVDDGEVLLVRVLEPGKLGEAHRERRLPALETGAQRVARLEALGAATGGLSAPAAFAATDPHLRLLRSGGRLQMVQLELFLLFVGHFGSYFSSTSTR